MKVIIQAYKHVSMRVRKQHGEQRLCTCPGSKDMAWRRSEQQHGDKILAEHRSCVPAVHRASGAVHHSTYPFAPLHEADLSFDLGPNARAAPEVAIFNHKCSHASTTAFVNGAPYIVAKVATTLGGNIPSNIWGNIPRNILIQLAVCSVFITISSQKFCNARSYCGSLACPGGTHSAQQTFMATYGSWSFMDTTFLLRDLRHRFQCSEKRIASITESASAGISFHAGTKG